MMGTASGRSLERDCLRKRFWIPVSVLALALLILEGCSDDRERLAGSGSVTTNGVKGTVTRDGLPASGIKVSLYDAAFDPVRDGALPDTRRQLTDRTGGYRFENLPAGTYNLIAEHPTEATAALLAGIAVPASDTVQRLAGAALVPTGTVRVRLPENARATGAYVYLPGTGISALIDSAAAILGEVPLERVPAARYESLLFTGSGGEPTRNLLVSPLVVPPEGAAKVYPYAGWKNAYRIAINTAATGADVGETLRGFPMLVRLTAANFDFSQAKADGADLRVTRGDSATLLPFELETWDPAGRTADLWVRVDTVRGNDASQFLCLFSGRADAAAAVFARPVFDTAQGFAGVWHLGESPVQSGSRDAVIRDRTANGFHGIPGGAMPAAASVPGVVGRGLQFDGKDDQVELPASNLFLPDSNTSITMSAWIRPGPIQPVGDSIRHRLLSFKTDTSGISALAWGISNTGEMSHYSRASDSVYRWSGLVTADSLYFVALTSTAGGFRGYVNGRLDFSADGVSLKAGGANPLILGAHLPGKLNFQGLIDEVRIERTPRSPGWIALSYASQRPDEGCVTIAPFAKP